jgi:hypothetical protein
MLERERQLGVVLLLVGRRCGHHGTDVTDGDEARDGGEVNDGGEVKDGGEVSAYQSRPLTCSTSMGRVLRQK